MYYWLTPSPFRLWVPCFYRYWVLFNSRRFVYHYWVNIWWNVISKISSNFLSNRHHLSSLIPLSAKYQFDFFRQPVCRFVFFIVVVLLFDWVSMQWEYPLQTWLLILIMLSVDAIFVERFFDDADKRDKKQKVIPQNSSIPHKWPREGQMLRVCQNDLASWLVQCP